MNINQEMDVSMLGVAFLIGKFIIILLSILLYTEISLLENQ